MWVCICLHVCTYLIMEHMCVSLFGCVCFFVSTMEMMHSRTLCRAHRVTERWYSPPSRYRYWWQNFVILMLQTHYRLGNNNLYYSSGWPPSDITSRGEASAKMRFPIKFRPPDSPVVTLMCFSLHEKIVKLAASAKKVMTTVFWDCQGIILIEYIQRWKTWQMHIMHYNCTPWKLSCKKNFDCWHTKWSFFITSTILEQRWTKCKNLRVT